MKIERTDSLHPIRPAAKQNAPESEGVRFKDILHEAVSSAPGTSQPGMIKPLPPAGAGLALRPIAGRGELLSRADALLGLLDSLQKGLSGPEWTTKDAYAAVRAIEDRADELAPLVERLPQGDPLRDFMNRIVITASVEAIKFRRGDYL